MLSLTVDLEHRGDGDTTFDACAPIKAQVTAAVRHGAPANPNRVSGIVPNRSPLLAQMFSTPATLMIRSRGQWTHLKVTLPTEVAGTEGASEALAPVARPVAARDRAHPAAAGVTILVAALRDGVPIHVRSSLPTMAGLKGGTYERPSLTLGTALARPSLGTAV